MKRFLPGYATAVPPETGPVTPPYMSLCQFTLAPGANPVIAPQSGALPVIPQGAATFSLSQVLENECQALARFWKA